MVNDQDVGRPFGCVQFQSELLLTAVKIDGPCMSGASALVLTLEIAPEKSLATFGDLSRALQTNKSDVGLTDRLVCFIAAPICDDQYCEVALQHKLHSA